MLASLFVALCLVASAPGQEEGCGGAQTPFEAVTEAGAFYSKCNFPPDQFNVACLLASCPSLSNLCPFASNGNIDSTALTSAVSSLNNCIKQNSLICNYNMSRTQMAPLSWTTAEFIPPTVASGTVVHNLGTGFVENFSNATFTLLQNGNANGPMVTLTIQMPNYYSYGNFNSTFDMAPTSVLRSLKGLIPALTSLNAPNINGTIRVNVTATVSIDPSPTTPTITTQQQHFDLDIVFNFFNADGESLEQALEDHFNQGLNAIAKQSAVPPAIIDFLSNYAAVGLQAAQYKCPSQNYN